MLRNFSIDKLITVENKRYTYQQNLFGHAMMSDETGRGQIARDDLDNHGGIVPTPMRRVGPEPVPGFIGEHCACPVSGPGEPRGMSLRVRSIIDNVDSRFRGNDEIRGEECS